MKSNRADVNPYDSPQTTDDSDVRSAGISVSFVLAILATGALPALVFFVNRYALAIFQDFDIELPVMTRLALSPAFSVFACLLCVAVLAKEFFLPPRASRVLNVLACLAVVCLGAAYAFVIFMPLVSLIENLA